MVDKKKLGLAVGLMGILIVGGTFSWKWNMVREAEDGDTLVTGNGTQIRLLGINAPERGLCGYNEATAELARLTAGKTLKMSEVKVDRFRRILAVVKIEGEDINQKMISSGWALWDGTRNNQGEKYANAANEARENQRGIYRLCRAQDSPKCLIKGNRENRSGTAAGKRKIYFYPGCSEYESVVVEKEKGEQWFCSETEAMKAGYVKGNHCP